MRRAPCGDFTRANKGFSCSPRRPSRESRVNRPPGAARCGIPWAGRTAGLPIEFERGAPVAERRSDRGAQRPSTRAVVRQQAAAAVRARFGELAAEQLQERLEQLEARAARERFFAERGHTERTSAQPARAGHSHAADDTGEDAPQQLALSAEPPEVQEARALIERLRARQRGPQAEITRWPRG